MPPKRAALAQALRDAYPEDVSATAVEQLATKTLAAADTYLNNIRAARVAIINKNYTAQDAVQTPKDIVEALRQYQDFAHEAYLTVEQVRTVVVIRAPELKEEDNLGVAVQIAVLKMLDSLQSKLLGGGDKEGVSAAMGLYGLKEYLSARSAVEEKLLGKPAEDGKPAQGTKAPSATLELRQVDADALLKAEIATVQMTTQLRALINVYALNWKKLIQPRSSGSDRMIS